MTEKEFKKFCREWNRKYFTKGKRYAKDFTNQMPYRRLCNVKAPKITFKLKGNTYYGMAYYWKWEIAINYEQLKKHTPEKIQEVVGHEVAHLITHAIHGNKRLGGSGRRHDHHGDDWKRTMRAFGLPPERCFKY